MFKTNFSLLNNNVLFFSCALFVTMAQVKGVGDLVLLEPITEDNLLDTLSMRLKAGSIYVI